MQSRRAVGLCREDDFKGTSFPDHFEESRSIVSFCMADRQVKVIFDQCFSAAKRGADSSNLEPG